MKTPQSVLDAQADAETLRLSSAQWVEVWTAQQYGQHAARYADQDESVAYGAARYAARAAIRGVPGLRA